MAARRLLTALLIAVAISGLFTFWVGRKISRPHAAPPAPVRQRFVVAARAMQSGEVLEPASLTTAESPSTAAIPGSFAKVPDVAGRALLYPLTPGEPILERYLAPAGSGSGLTVRIPPGMRAISLKSDEVMGVSGFLLPGTYVDVLVTYHASNNAEPVTATVLQDVQVIASGQKIQPDPEGKPSTVSVVTLLLSSENAEKAALASNQGAIHFVLRNGADRAEMDTLPISMAQIAQGGARPRPMAGTVKRVAAVKPSEPVETFLGEKRVVANFE